MIELYCQHCGQHMEIADQYAGQAGTCKNCGGKIAVPTRASKSQALPSVSQRASGIPYVWIAGAAVFAVVLALGTYMIVSRDASLPVATSPEASIAGHIIEFPTDRVVGELRLRDFGAQTWGRPIGQARGPFLVPDGREVSLSVNHRHSADLTFLQALAPNDLHKLVLQPTSMTNRELRNIEHLTGLKELWIEYGDLTDAGLRSFQGLTNLEYIYVYGTNITDAGLATLGSLGRLKSLALCRTKITHRGILSLKSLPALEVLYLSGITLNRSMVDVLKEIPGLTTLYVDSGLTHASNMIGGTHGPASLESMALLGEVTQLRALVLRGKLHDDSLVPPLSQLTHLKQIEFFDTSVTPAGMDELRRALPNCKVIP